MKLLSSVTLGKHTLKNRMAMAPMTRCRAVGNVANSLIATYYAQRASAGLIITEGISPSPNGLGYARIPGIYSAEQVASWKPVTAAVHKNGGVIFAQLMHTGRIAHQSNLPEGAKIIAPSAIKAQGHIFSDSLGMVEHGSPLEMDHEMINEVISEYATAARNAIEAGFDGIEIHSASGYLPNQFLATNANQRTDVYGGSYDNRARLVLEIVEAVTTAIGSDKVGIKFSPGMAYNDIHIADSKAIYSYLASSLNKFNLAYVHVMRHVDHLHENPETSEGFDSIQLFRNLYKGTLLIGAGYSKESAELLLEQGNADMVVFGNLFISNPDLPKRFETNADLQPALRNMFYTADEKGFTDYRALV